jgi:hypothetical protein
MSNKEFRDYRGTLLSKGYQKGVSRTAQTPVVY